ncbi:MAG: hypothetical protein CMI09_16225 [Oceanospirillaceae bacterium]|nr:hypothetical protein [Oceanospirillaceae bacterium]
MIIEVRKAGFTNKGAELMLHAILAQVRERYPDSTVVMSPTTKKGSQPFHKFVKLGMLPKASLRVKGFQFGFLAGFLPQRLREMYGIVLDKEVDVILDASGFDYSDQWGPGSSIEMAQSTKSWRRNGKVVVMLPQAFGPFANNGIKTPVRNFVENSDIVYAREKDSFDHLVSVCGKRNNIKIMPDFTNLVTVSPPAGYDFDDKRIAVIPNCRMLDKTDSDAASLYVPFLKACIEILIKNGKNPFILVHEGEDDLALANQVAEGIEDLKIVKETDALAIKGIIGSCGGVVGSRFHGLVSALSQGVPSVATGWSHKYQRLFEDYGVSESVIDVSIDTSYIESKLICMTDSQAALVCRQNLIDKSKFLKKQSEDMWKEVFDLIDSKVFE